MTKVEVYRPKNHVRFVTASSLFDGHDASVNIMRRILQSSGVEVIHLGHNRSVEEVVNAAIQEDAQGIAVSSYQGGHMEYFKYMYDLLREKGAPHIKIYGGGGGVILPREIKELHAYGVAGIFSPEDGRVLGLQGMINEQIKGTDFPTATGDYLEKLDALTTETPEILANLITAAESNNDEETKRMLEEARKRSKGTPILGITGTGGAGKSSLTDELIRRFLKEFPEKRVAILSVDPTKQKTGGALLGDRIRMNAIFNNRVYMRSLATRGSRTELSASIGDVLDVVRVAGYDLIIVETSGIGQGDAEITKFTDLSMYVMTSEFGAPTQLEKIDMIDFADVIAINKFERKGSEDALRQVQKQYQRSRELWDEPIDKMPVYGTIASQFNDKGTNALFAALVQIINQKTGSDWETGYEQFAKTQKQDVIIPNDRRYYLREITDTVRGYHKKTEQQVAFARRLFQLEGAIAAVMEKAPDDALVASLTSLAEGVRDELTAESKRILDNWQALKQAYAGDEFVTKVRDKEIRTILTTTSLSGTKIPKVVLPKFVDYGEILRWVYRENVPGEFPYTAGVFQFKREGEDPKRQFAGEGTPERTNKRFHYLSKDDDAKRLSTAFDSVTLYGEDPDYRPDIYGKVGESGVSICTLEDMKKLYAGFDLCAPSTSVSMTINGPAPIILAMFMNTAIEQQVQLREKELGRPLTVEEFTETREKTLQVVRGTVQADILKEDQGQNTCIFSTEFALRMMGDIQQYFIDKKVRNYYSVSISGYHIAEAGANPISQLAFTLANGFTYVEYYLSRGMNIDDFAPNLSFFFSNGLDPEYTVIGRVARRIWAVVMRDKYGANDRAQKLKYHIQTSGRSLHAQEIDFNDIRTTLQALMALQDNCNSLHTNAYDEAITTPTEESVRRAMAIQMIITKEHGLAKNENPLQGAFIVEELTDLVEEAVLEEFDRINDRGGVLGAMETQYQRGKIQEESMHYEMLKHSGELPIIGVNTYLNPNPPTDDAIDNMEIARASSEEKETQIRNLQLFWQQHEGATEAAIARLQEVAVNNGNIFEELMETVKVASLGQITKALYEVGGQFRRNM
ncbi:methylmalonyl-CoA mutase [Lysinibacillus sphaericus]|uniref:Fused isobutyryl-CoA mutase n=3 Tax=Bacillaceae TaxID=186817 RepID=A0A2S0K523_LYSSH|nr:MULTISPECIES: fused isobutyryl-CoA mutase/GTPase IcmF [Lysinibacillus]AVK98461.1 methylmalonyl-CoA mutase [Lysinibacillus sphaericus]MED4543986.1 methylmalonyl-CoA mutase family protein [Lysinibacillus sphaericus]TKI17455.1 methylmalonyl-CoA mutase [Lysinibacillus sphaericus]TKI48845.1 methylmalonyl-CoA mutase [Lysinibacillus tabacifolii]SUV15573.1 methylmalonyl-CoA mutase, large subunit [Lysinibacillus sphaericus]